MPQSHANYIARSHVKPSLQIEKEFLQDTRHVKTQNLSSMFRQYRQQLRANLIFLSLFDTIRLCRYIATLDDKTDNIIRSKHQNLLARPTDKRYGSKSSMFYLNIINFSRYTRGETEEFVLKHGLEFLIPPTRIKGGTRGVVGGARGVVVIVVGNGHGDTSSNPGRDWLHFT